jgi:16S rRNA (uracil1498-N3)-methyltransferase
MHRFYLPPEQCRNSTLELTDNEAHHALRVLRLEPGDAATVLDGAGHTFSCEVTETSKRTVQLVVNEKTFSPPLPCAITLLQAMPKPKALDYIVQKATELGVTRIVPLLTERVVSQLDERAAADKAEKLLPVALEAIKQCGSPWLPKIEAPLPLKKFLERHEAFDLPVVASLHPGSQHFHQFIEQFRVTHQRLPTTAAAWVGPEGDFTPAEIELILSSGAHPITLGRLVLRSDTAAIYSLAVLNHELQPSA